MIFPLFSGLLGFEPYTHSNDQSNDQSSGTTNPSGHAEFMAATTDLLTAARAEALFSSDMPTGATPSGAEIGAAIRNAVRTHGGTRGCATLLAGEYGDHPETAVARMRWALSTIRSAYSPTSGQRLAHASPLEDWDKRTG